MGFSLKKLGRGLKKIAKKNRGGFGRLVKKVGPGLVLSAATGAIGAPLIAKAISTGKSLGKKVKGLESPKSLVPVIRAASVKGLKPKRTRMPGGAPVARTPRKRRRDFGYDPLDARITTGTIAPVQVRALTKSTPQAKGSLYTKPKKAKRKMTKPPTAKQLAARERFKAMVAAKRKKAA